MTEGTHQPLTIEDIRECLEDFDTNWWHPDPDDAVCALRMLVAAWEATEPEDEGNPVYPSAMAISRNALRERQRRAIFGRTEDPG